METQNHSMQDLFAQLGLPADSAAIDAFIRRHAPLDGAIPLHEAPFWSATQATFLRTELCEDADWAAIVDELNARLRTP
ncbi:MAG TPA: DUF2789 domain-containing protein [Rhodocyclaceae bacterium]|nr:DUF2789 domain-containing protein [Rhodocyclaceae bacterium]